VRRGEGNTGTCLLVPGVKLDFLGGPDGRRPAVLVLCLPYTILPGLGIHRSNQIRRIIGLAPPLIFLFLLRS